MEPWDLEQQPDRAAELCVAAHQRLLARVNGIDDDTARSASLLPGWSVGHVLTHLARNADGHAHRLRGALDGLDLPRYPGGRKQREGEIEAGAGRPAAELVADLAESQRQLEQLFVECAARGWPSPETVEAYGAQASPAHRLREAEMHHVDLGLGYLPGDWPEDYVAWDLRDLLASVPERLDPGARRDFMAWLSGRGPLDPTTRLAAW